jgi:Fe2+ or Zn2+ uptake regulation protein
VRDAIYNVLGKHNKPMRFKDIYLEVSKAIKNIGKNNVWLAISRMQHKGLIRKVNAGVYELVTGAKK